MADNQTLANMLRQKLQSAVDFPTTVVRNLTDPQAFLKSFGYTPNQQLSGFSAGYAGVPEKPPSDIGVLDPNNREYSKGYESGEEAGLATGILGGTAALARPIAKPVAKAIGQEAWNRTEKMMQQQGLMPSVVPFVTNKNASAFVPNVKSGEEMIVQHNLTPEKLYAVEKLGGLPVPSLAISKVKNPLEEFGDITLIGNKNMATPARQNPIYSTDAYTARKPHIVTQTDRIADDFITNKLAEHYGELKNHKDTLSAVSGYTQNLDSNLQDTVLLKMQYLREKGLLPDSKNYGTPSEFRMAARNAFDKLPSEKQSPFYDWQIDYIDKLKKEAQDVGGSVKSLLYKGSSNTTGRALYEPATLENIVKRMSSKNAGAEGNGNLFTAGSLRAKLIPKLKNQSDVLKNRSKIVSETESQQIKDNLNSTHEFLTEDLSKFLKENNSKIDVRSFLEELALGTANKYEYSREIAQKVPQELKDRISAYTKELKDAPTGYFEIKPKRAVQLNEFAGAIVPKETTAKTMSVLEKNGIKDIYKYANPEERKSLLQKFGKEMFAGVPILGLSRKEQLEEEFKKIE
jgi:DNA-binding MarR family transcriptional regulator